MSIPISLQSAWRAGIAVCLVALSIGAVAASATTSVWAAGSPAAPTQASAETGTLAIATTPAGAAVIINDRRLGTTPFEMALPAGTEIAVRLELAGYAPVERRVTLAVGQVERIELELTAAP